MAHRHTWMGVRCKKWETMKDEEKHGRSGRQNIFGRLTTKRACPHMNSSTPHTWNVVTRHGYHEKGQHQDIFEG